MLFRLCLRSALFAGSLELPVPAVPVSLAITEGRLAVAPPVAPAVVVVGLDALIRLRLPPRVAPPAEIPLELPLPPMMNLLLCVRVAL